MASETKEVSLSVIANKIASTKRDFDVGNDIAFLDGVLTKLECGLFIEYIRCKGYEGSFASADLSEVLWRRMRGKFPFMRTVDDVGELWTCVGISPEIQFVQDEVKMGRSVDESDEYLSSDKCIMFNALVYLNTIDPDKGGVTNFPDYSFRVQAKSRLAVVYKRSIFRYKDEPSTMDKRRYLKLRFVYKLQNTKFPQQRQRLFELEQQAIINEIGQVEDKKITAEIEDIHDKMCKEFQNM